VEEALGRGSRRDEHKGGISVLSEDGFRRVKEMEWIS
jgi:hypothetical protein